MTTTFLEISVKSYILISVFFLGYQYNDNDHLPFFKRVIQSLIYTIGIPIFIGTAICGIVYKIWCIAQLKAYWVLFISRSFKKWDKAKIVKFGENIAIFNTIGSLQAKHMAYVSQLAINKWKAYKGIKSLHKNNDTGEWEVIYT